MSLIARLSALCAEHRLREKIVVAPSLAIGHQIADAIAHNGTPWVNLRIETMRTISDAVAGFDLARQGMTVLSRAQALAIIERACDRVLDSSSYFAALADRPGLHRAIQKSIDDLRHAGVNPSRMRPSAFEDSRKAEDLARILTAYEEELARGKYVDRFGVLTRATQMLSGVVAVFPSAARDSEPMDDHPVSAGDSSPSSRLGMTNGSRVGMTGWSPDALWVVISDVELTAAEETFLRLAAGNFELVGEAAAADFSKVRFRRGVGEENEVRGAFRAILETKGTFDDAEIIYSTRDPYLPLIYELAAEYEVPCTFAEGVASHFTRPGQACLAFLRWIGNGWHAAELQDVALAGAAGTVTHARILRQAGIGWGRERYLPRIDALIADRQSALTEEENEGRRAGIERTIKHAQEARAFVADLLRISAEVSTGQKIDSGAAAAAGAKFVAEFAAVRNEVDAMAREGLRRLFDELAAIAAPAGSSPLQRSEVTSRLAQAVRALHVSASNPRPGFLHIAPVRAGGWSARSRLFMAGLDEQRHPGTGLQDPIILDVEREALGIPVVGDRPQKTTEQFRRLLSRSTSREVTLSYSILGLRERRERFPSPALLDVYRRSSGKGDATFEDLERDVAKEGFVDPQPLSSSEWWLMRRFIDRDINVRSAVLAAYPALAAGAEAEAARDGDEITAWDGRISAAREELDPRLNDRVYSASQLETMASCPYRYFLQRILRVQPLDDIQYEPDSWLEAREFGTMLHDVLQTTMEEICAAGQKPSLAFLPRMNEIANVALWEWRTKIPPPSEAAFERRSTELLDSNAIFLRTEETACRTVTPTYFEHPFDEFRLPLGHGKSVKLRGRIDRIDHDEASDEWHVWDYKSGSTYNFDRGGRLQCGTKIQHAVYARAVESMIRERGQQGRVTRSGYFFPTPKGSGARLPRECTDSELKDALNLLFDVIGSGYFPHAGEDACRFCDFQDVCGGAKRAAERTLNKVGRNASDPAVAAWLRLKEVK